jgi:hypothetical protein
VSPQIKVYRTEGNTDLEKLVFADIYLFLCGKISSLSRCFRYTLYTAGIVFVVNNPGYGNIIGVYYTFPFRKT